MADYKKTSLSLPSGYQIVEYIETTGANYINTGISPDSTTTCDVTFAYNSLVAGASVFGCYNTNENMTTFYLYNISGTMIAGLGRDNNIVTLPAWDLNKHRCKLVASATASKVIYDGVEYNGKVVLSDLSKNIVLGAMIRNTGAVDLYSKTKFYYCRIEKQGYTVRELIPCYQTSDGVIGMYDLIKKEFLVASGSGALTKGANYEPIYAKIEIDGKEVVKIANGSTIIYRPYINQYVQRLHYIHSDNDSTHVELNYSLVTASNMIADMELDETPSSSWYGYFGGSGENWNSVTNMCIRGTSSKKLTADSAGTYKNDFSSVVLNTRVIADLKISGATVTKKSDSSSMGTWASGKTALTSASYKTWVFGANIPQYNSGDMKRSPRMKLFRFTIKEGSTIKLDLVPCKLIENLPDSYCYNTSLAHTKGTVGLWDITNSKFYTDNAGIGFSYA